MSDWDHKIAKFSKHEAAKNSQLSAQFAQQDKATRAWANNKIKGLVASTAAQFNKVYATMAKNRHAVDMALKHAAQKFAAALNAQKALQNKRLAEAQRDIAAAKEQAKNAVAKATVGYKVQLLSLQSTVTEQVSKVNDRVDKTAGVVRSNKAAQAKVNANVNAEMNRMIKLGNKRYKEETKKDIELQKQINKNQAKKNAKMAADIRRMRLDAMNNVRKAKESFNKKIQKLTGLVKKNALKSKMGRQQIQATEDANKAELKTAIRKAIATGEKRAELVEERGEKMDKDTKFLVNNKLDSEITALRKSTDASVEALRLQSKEARAQAH